MRIAHLCLSSFYIDGRSYQENELVRQHVTDGHDVLVIASTQSHASDGSLTYLEPSRYTGSEGAPVIRLPYRFWPPALARKLRMHPGVYALLAEFRPDVILFHGSSGWEVMTAARYARDNPGVLFYVDSHSDWNNSARSFFSREILHKFYYRFCLRRALRQARKVLCISTEIMDFAESVYRVPRDKLEFYPLAGTPIPDAEYAKRRKAARAELKLRDDQILLVQSGKLTRRKNLIESLKAFATNAPANAVLAVAGTFNEDIRTEATALMQGMPNVRFLGWKNSAELTDLLCAADIYLQPGTQSVTMQHSLCCHCAVIIDDVPAHSVYINGNGWLVNKAKPLERIFGEIASADLASMQARSYAFARERLDYAVLANRILRATP